MRYQTKSRLRGLTILLCFTFFAPVVLAIPVIASIAYLHHNWWSAIPVMHYWTAYWWQVICIGLGGAAWMVLRHIAAKIDD